MNKNNLDKIELSTYVIMFIALFAILKLNFLPLLFSMIFTYLIIDNVNVKVMKWKSKILNKRVEDLDGHHETRQWLTVTTTTVLTLLIGGLFVGLSLFLYNFFKVDNLSIMSSKFISILENIKDNPNMPKFVLQYIPDNVLNVKTQIIEMAKNHLSDIGKVSKATITGLVYVIVGFIVGAMLSFHNLKKNNEIYDFDQKENETCYPLTEYLLMRINGFKRNFENVFIAQMKISLINSILTGIYLLVILPILGIDIPFKYLLVLITFVVGLIPVIGNLISNTLIIVFSFSVSFYTAICSLVFLIVIHKLEYFLNAKIIGNEINAAAWELLLAMILFEHLFGIAGVIVAPIYYAYLKYELKFKKLI